MANDRIVVRGAREHNLKAIDLELPRDQLVVITGLSGSGKSSLAFDTIYAEGQRRYVESLSAYARQFLEQMEKPDVDSIEGLSPAISIEQKTTSKNPRSTVGTVTEIYDYLRVLFARVGIPHCPQCGNVISAQTVQQMVDRVMTLPAGTRIVVLSPIVRGRKGEYRKLFYDLRRQGYVRVRVNGQLRELTEDIELAKTKKHTIEVVVDRLVVKDNLGGRLADSLETALRLADGVVQVEVPDGPSFLFSERLACAACGISFPEVSPRMFSFNNPYGACPDCGGIGTRYEIDPERVVPDPAKTARRRARCVPWAGPSASSMFKQTLRVLAKRHGFSLDTPWAKLPKKTRDIILFGEPDDGFEGVVKMLDRRYEETVSEDTRQRGRAVHERSGTARPAAARGCAPRRSRSRSRGGPSPTSCASRSRRRASSSRRSRSPSGSMAIARRVLKEIRERLGFLSQVGLDYLTLDRPAATLSGGEGQRIRLATQIGSSLVGVLYILDEPSIGLHQRDNGRLLDTLKRLRDLGNTVLVVEHDEETIRAADYVVDLGPGAGELGGHVVAVGTPDEVMANPASLTGRFLAGDRGASRCPRSAGKANGKFVIIHNPREHNLKGMNVRIPLGTFTAITGVSGSGKSTLVNDILYRALASMLHRAQDRPGAHDRIEGAQHLDKVIDIDQSPIGRTPRSNPATYTGVFTLIRTLHGAHPGRARARLRAGPVLVQRQGRALRGLPGRRAREDRDALPARRVRDLRGLQAASATTARRSRCATRARTSPTSSTMTVAEALGVLRAGALDQAEAPDAARRRARLHPARPGGDHAVGRRGAAGEARHRAEPARHRAHALHPGRADHRAALRRHPPAARGAQPARRPGQHGGDHRAQPGRHQDRGLGHRPRAPRAATRAAASSPPARPRRWPGRRSRTPASTSPGC